MGAYEGVPNRGVAYLRGTPNRGITVLNHRLIEVKSVELSFFSCIVLVTMIQFD